MNSVLILIWDDVRGILRGLRRLFNAPQGLLARRCCGDLRHDRSDQIFERKNAWSVLGSMIGQQSTFSYSHVSQYTNQETQLMMELQTMSSWTTTFIILIATRIFFSLHSLSLQTCPKTHLSISLPNHAFLSSLRPHHSEQILCRQISRHQPNRLSKKKQVEREIGEKFVWASTGRYNCKIREALPKWHQYYFVFASVGRDRTVALRRTQLWIVLMYIAYMYPAIFPVITRESNPTLRNSLTVTPKDSSRFPSTLAHPQHSASDQFTPLCLAPKTEPSTDHTTKSGKLQVLVGKRKGRRSSSTVRVASPIDLHLRWSHSFSLRLPIRENLRHAAVDTGKPAKGETGEGYVAD